MCRYTRPPMPASVFEDLTWRGLIANSTDPKALEGALAAGSVVVYCGFDPTAPSLHFGNLVQLVTLRRLQLAGHRPIAVVGGATGLIGDPSGRNEERSLNTSDVVAAWVDRIRAKEAVAARMAAGGISYTEFSYQILQALDYLELYRRYACTLQTGGSDQWGNLTAGVDLVRRVEGAAVHALATPLLTKSDGSKYGKTAEGTLWLDPGMSSPFAFYQYFLNQADDDVGGLLRVFSFRSDGEIEELERSAKEKP